MTIGAPNIENAAYMLLTLTVTVLNGDADDVSLLQAHPQQRVISGFGSDGGLRPNGGRFCMQMVSAPHFTRQSYISEADMFGFNAEV